MKGYFGNYLDISLTSGRVTTYPIPEKWHRKYLGGRGIGARILLEEMARGIDPLGPKNIVVFATGPLQGLNIPGAGRHLIMSKSPKTNSVNGSYVGGFFGQELGESGYDGLIIRGASENPKYIVIKNGETKIKDAEDLWGKNTAEFEDQVQEREGDVKIASIGQAGENLINFSCIIDDKNRAAGRPGFGAIFGSKKLKGIAIKGDDKKSIKSREKLKSLRREFANKLVETKEHFGKYGSADIIPGYSELHLLPTKNFQQAEFSGADDISGEKMADTILKGRENCTACPVRCKRVVETEFNGEEVRPECGGPEYETMAAFGSLCLNSNLDSIALANQKCNQYGLDTISTGVAIAFAMEASEKGLLEEDIEWGDSKAVVDLVDKIAFKKGLGEELAKGVSVLKEEWEGVDFALEIKGQEVPMHEPRGKKALGLSYATTPRGANHMEGPHDNLLENKPLAPEIGITEPMDRFSYEGKPQATKTLEDLRSFTNSLIMCTYTTDSVGENYAYNTIRKFVQAVTGNTLSPEEMLEIGERNYLLLRLLATNEGYSAREDELPKRLQEPLPSGEDFPQEKLDEMLSTYYDLRGYNDNGVPTPEKLAELEMDDIG